MKKVGIDSKKDHVALIRRGRDAILKWRTANPRIRLDIGPKVINGKSLLSGDPDLNNLDLRDVQFSPASLFLVNLSGSDLSGADLEDCDIRGTNFSGCTMNGCSLEGANMEHIVVGPGDIVTRFKGASIRQANLSHANMKSVLAQDAIFDGSDLSNANAQGSYFTNASFREAKLYNIDLRKADLRGVDFTGADLRAAVLSGCKLSGANFDNVILGETVLVDVDLVDVKNLHSVRHERESKIDLSSIANSKKQLSERFLWGVGVHPRLVISLQDLSPVEYYSCFISYSSEDLDFAKKLYTALIDNGVRTWFAPKHIRGGKKLHEQILSEIKKTDKLLVVLSDNSIQSKWVCTEILEARERERHEGLQILFPIRITEFSSLTKLELFDADEGLDLGREIRQYFIPDFSRWRNKKAFEDALRGLLQALGNLD